MVDERSMKTRIIWRVLGMRPALTKPSSRLDASY